MAPNSYDDQYEKCPSEMENKLMNLTTDGFKERYNITWENATNRWIKIEGSLKSLPNDFKDKYGIALIAYTANNSLYEDFGPAVREGGRSSEHYEKCFTFKSFHFLLTRASQVLKGSKEPCYDVYRGTRDKRFTVSDINARVRFGQFTSSSLSQQAAQKFGEDTFFRIKTCLGNNIIKFSYFPEQQEILIPPYEVFKVKDVTNVSGKTQIELESDGKHSNFNCGSKRGKTPIWADNLDPAASALFLAPKLQVSTPSNLAIARDVVIPHKKECG
ncbi:GPI-linked NAD(P)(+)--arginine ADP-ribosyltransferase 1-like [Anolis carolinensis]|uniref:GPI-linked NAD(P)(+)--arginine ADP-ribosyltransferase 1-like n=1 Tax=Anolis carolinensis TaxID=28377 RepID=UPI002F2B4382